MGLVDKVKEIGGALLVGGVMISALSGCNQSVGAAVARTILVDAGLNSLYHSGDSNAIDTLNRETGISIREWRDYNQDGIGRHKEVGVPIFNVANLNKYTGIHVQGDEFNGEINFELSKNGKSISNKTGNQCYFSKTDFSGPGTYTIKASQGDANLLRNINVR